MQPHENDSDRVTVRLSPTTVGGVETENDYYELCVRDVYDWSVVVRLRLGPLALFDLLRARTLELPAEIRER